MIHMTTAATYTVPSCAGIEIVVNAALTGTITVTDSSGGVVAVITNPAVGNRFPYFGFVPGNLTVVNSATADATINVLDVKRA